jgi:hypothetical protein
MVSKYPFLFPAREGEKPASGWFLRPVDELQRELRHFRTAVVQVLAPLPRRAICAAGAAGRGLGVTRTPDALRANVANVVVVVVAVQSMWASFLAITPRSHR